MNKYMPLIEQIAATLAAYYAVRLVRHIHIEHQVSVAMKRLEREHLA